MKISTVTIMPLVEAFVRSHRSEIITILSDQTLMRQIRDTGYAITRKLKPGITDRQMAVIYSQAIARIKAII